MDGRSERRGAHECAAFSAAYPNFGGVLLTISLVLFAFTTILGWNYYGERCMVYLFGTKYIKLYRVVFVIMTLVGGFLKLDAIWALADILNALMAFPNLIALLCLSSFESVRKSIYNDNSEAF